MPELAAVYLAGLIAGFALTILFIFLRIRRQKSTPFALLEANLRKAGLYWSENSDSIVPWAEARLEMERAAANRSTAIAGGLLSLLSWPGVFFLLIIMVSFRFLARSRREIRLLSSPLASDPNLSADEVRDLLKDLDIIPTSQASLTTTT